MALDIIANETWDDVDKAWDAFTLETWEGWIEFGYALKIYDTSGDKVAEIISIIKFCLAIYRKYFHRRLII